MNRTHALKDGFLLLCLGALVFVLVGFGVRLAQHDDPMDVRVAQACARCMIQSCDPYNAENIVRLYKAEGGPLRPNTGDLTALQTESLYVYLPTIFVLTVPIAVLPFAAFYAVWLGLIVISFLLAAFLMWDIGKHHAPLLTGALLGFYLANSGSTISVANAGGLAVSLCIISVWCFFSRRFEVAGVLCLAVSLAIKPHDSGLVCLCLIAFGGVPRKRAWQTLLVYACLSLPVLLWTFHTVPDWRHELHAHLTTLSAHGAVSDPGPSTVFKRGVLMLTNLQSAISLIRDNPRFYDAITYAACLVLLGITVLLTLRFRPSRENSWLAIASVATLSMLPLYHRLYDSKLVMLTIPACAILWHRGGRMAKLALLATVLALVVTAELPWAFYLLFAGSLVPTAGAFLPLLIASIAVPIPLTLLLVTIFYQWIYATQQPMKPGSGECGSQARRVAGPSATLAQ